MVRFGEKTYDQGEAGNAYHGSLSCARRGDFTRVKAKMAAAKSTPGKKGFDVRLSKKGANLRVK